MRRIIQTTYLTFFLVLLTCVNAKAQFTDNFSDSDFTANPTWTGDTANFEIDASHELHLNAPAVASTSILVTPSQAISNAMWTFLVKFDFNPSSSNYARVYLVANDSAIENPLNGYYVMIGNTDDEVSLYRQDGSSDTKIIDGTNGRLNTSTVDVRVKVTRDSVGNWALYSDTTGGTTYYTEGTANDMTYITSNYFGVYCNYTSTRSTKFYYDDFNVTGTAYQDTIKPVIDSISIASQNQLNVFFSETVDLTSSQIGTNYSVNNGIGTASSATRDAVNKNIAHLTFGNSFTQGQSYILSTINVQDTSGNIMLPDNHPFTYLIPATAGFRDLVINELMADPSPQIGLPNAEYVEIYNPSDSIYDLNNWTISNGSSTATLPAHYLYPGDYLILCSSADSANLQLYGNVLSLSSLPALTNGGDDITLKNKNNILIDAVDYDLSWYHDANKDDGGWSLEQKNPKFPCDNAGNWAASTNPNGGTPGIQNSIYDTTADTIAPYITSVAMLSTTQLQVYFSEQMDSASIATASYSIDNGITVSTVSVQSGFQSAILNLSPAVDSSTLYTLVMNGGNDCSGNLLQNDSITFGYGVAPQAYEIVIDEVYPNYDNSVGLPLAEYAELYNRSNKVLNLNACTFSDPLTTATFPSVTLNPHSYIILCSTSSVSDFQPFGNTVGLSSFPSLNNSGDSLTLRNANGTRIISLNYSDDWYQDAQKEDGGWSLEMIDPNNPCGGIDNWHASYASIGGTPGTQNSDFALNPDNIPPKLESAIVYNDSTVVLTFDETLDSATAAGASFSINNGITVSHIAIFQYGNNTITLYLSTLLQHETVYTVTVSGLTDCVGNTINGDNTAQFALPDMPEAGDLIINEVLFNPNTGGSDFVELYNNSDKYIDLFGCYMANTDDNGTIDNISRISQHFLLFPGDYAMLSEDTANIKENYPKAHDKAFMQIEDLPPYNNDFGSVIVLDSAQNQLDRFDYNENMQFALLQSDKGVSLERISFDRPTNDPTNWHSASEDVGFATPGYLNSQSHQVQDNSGSVSVEPEVFSPDNDGHDDVVNIHYTFGSPGYVGNITIYDKNGRIVRHLLQNETLAAQGIVSWDGVNDNLEKARIGIYVIYFEAFDLKGNVKRYKKTCVLGGYLSR